MAPAVFKDTDGKYYMYFGGIWGEQLQRCATREYKAADTYPAADRPALTPKIAQMRADMKGFAEKVRDVVVLDEQGKPLTAGDTSGASRRRGSTATAAAYFSYLMATRTSSSARPATRLRPFTYRGKVLNRSLRTNHH
jgi:hypothetical protein